MREQGLRSALGGHVGQRQGLRPPITAPTKSGGRTASRRAASSRSRVRTMLWTVDACQRAPASNRGLVLDVQCVRDRREREAVAAHAADAIRELPSLGDPLRSSAMAAPARSPDVPTRRPTPRNYRCRSPPCAGRETTRLWALARAPPLSLCRLCVTERRVLLPTRRENEPDQTLLLRSVEPD